MEHLKKGLDSLESERGELKNKLKLKETAIKVLLKLDAVTDKMVEMQVQKDKAEK